jgi:hypothetical protein
VIEAYGKGLGEKKWKPIEAKLKEGKLAYPLEMGFELTDSAIERQEEGYDGLIVMGMMQSSPRQSFDGTDRSQDYIDRRSGRHCS